MERQLRAQPEVKYFNLGTELRNMEGWFETMLESLTLIDLCDESGGGTSGRFARFARKLSMSVNYWRTGAATLPLSAAVP